jgi:hypothetical protein
VRRPAHRAQSPEPRPSALFFSAALRDGDASAALSNFLPAYARSCLHCHEQADQMRINPGYASHCVRHSRWSSRRFSILKLRTFSDHKGNLLTVALARDRLAPILRSAVAGCVSLSRALRLTGRDCHDSSALRRKSRWQIREFRCKKSILKGIERASMRSTKLTALADIVLLSLNCWSVSGQDESRANGVVGNLAQSPAEGGGRTRPWRRRRSEA